MAGFKLACAPTHLPVRQRTQTGADRRRQDILASYGYKNTDWFFSTVLSVFMINYKQSYCRKTYWPKKKEERGF